MADFKIGGGKPGEGSGTFYRASDHIGHLLIYGNPVEQERLDRDRKPYAVAACDFVVCATCRKAWTDTDVSGKVLAPYVYSSENEITVTRLNQGEDKGDGRNPATVPENPIPDEIEEAQQICAKYAVRTPSGRVVFDVPGYNHDHTPLEPPPAT
jgi:hypothetical protein